MREMKIHWEVLDRKRLEILPKLEFLRKEYGFYLAGGTALALQMKHRTSIDFDFYGPRDFDPQVLFRKLKRQFKTLVSTHTAEGTLMVGYQDIEMSFFRYAYPLLKPLVRTEYLDLLSIQDIASMKIIAIVQRGTKRDFVDVYYLLKRLGLHSMVKFTEQKYPVFNRYIGLRALTYFEDADEDKSRRRLETFEKISWEKIKQKLIEAVDHYRKGHLSTR